MLTDLLFLFQPNMIPAYMNNWLDLLLSCVLWSLYSEVNLACMAFGSVVLLYYHG